MNLLFVCTKNQLRSLTAEHVFKNHPFHSVRSAGTASDARIKVTKSDIHWADVIFVMEKKHQEILLSKFSTEVLGKELVCLNIPDHYSYMDEDLVAILEEAVGSYL